jgi:hypothetical protein
MSICATQNTGSGSEELILNQEKEHHKAMTPTLTSEPHTGQIGPVYSWSDHPTSVDMLLLPKQ